MLAGEADPVADGEAGNAGAHRAHDPGAVAARHLRRPDGEHPGQQAPAQLPVARHHADGMNLDQQLVRPRFGIGQVDRLEFLRPAEAVETDGFQSSVLQSAGGLAGKLPRSA